jgi:hypothetical protein
MRPQIDSWRGERATPATSAAWLHDTLPSSFATWFGYVAYSCQLEHVSLFVAMSFGISIGDVMKLCELAGRVYRNCASSNQPRRDW